MIEVVSRKVLLIGIHQIKNRKLQNIIFSEPYIFVNPVELKLNTHLKSEIIAALIFDVSDDLNIIYELNNLKLICCNSVNLDYIDKNLLKLKHIMINSCPEATAESTSNTAIMLLLSVTRKINLALQANFNPTIYYDADKLNGTDLQNKKLGVVGLGHIGRSVAQKASLGFGLTVCYHQRNKNSEVSYKYFSDLNSMLSKVDFVVISCSLNKTTRNLFNLKRLRLMKPSAFLINVANGRIVQTDELVEALRLGYISGAALDMTEPQPLPAKHPLLVMDQVIVLPHIGMRTDKAQRTIITDTMECLKNYLGGRAMDIHS